MDRGVTQLIEKHKQEYGTGKHDEWKTDDMVFEYTDIITSEDRHPVENLVFKDVIKKAEMDLRQESIGIVHPEVKRIGGRELVFGSTMDRPYMQDKPPPSKMGYEHYYRSQFPSVSPFSYEKDEFTSSRYHQEKILNLNTKGWGFGNRNEPRFLSDMMDRKVDPGKYQPEMVIPVEKLIPKFPFGSSQPRFKELQGSKIPGPGTYDPEDRTGRRIETEQCFGSTVRKKKMKKIVEQFLNYEHIRKCYRKEQYLSLYY